MLNLGGLPGTAAALHYPSAINDAMQCYRELIAQGYANHAAAKADITVYIVGFYNCKRINSALGNLSPSVYEQKMAEHEPIVVSEIT